MPPFRPGDRVKCVDRRPHRHWLTLGHVCTVDLVSPDGRRVGLTTGPATMWDADQFVPHTKEIEMAAISLHTEFGAEIDGSEGPTGEFREVLEAKIVDHGGNVLQGPGEVGYWLRQADKSLRVPHKIVATKLGRKIVSADVLCAYAE